MVSVNGTELHVEDVGPRDAPVALEAADEFDRLIAEHLARVDAGLRART